MLPGMELMSCPDLAVPKEVMHHVVRVESSYNPYAIGVVRGRLVRQPRSLSEAVSTARMLEQRGYNFSLGLAQVNRYNLVKYGLNSYEQAFQPCANLVAGSRILRECYGRSGGDWGKSFSCYYSGDFRTGYRHGYVQKVFASMQQGGSASASVVAPIAVVGLTQRRIAGTQPAPASTLRRGESLAALMERRIGSHPTEGTQAAVPPEVNLAREPSVATASAPASQPQRDLPQLGRLVPSVALRTTLQEPAEGPVVVAATRLGAATPVPKASPPVGGPDGAFVF